MGCAGGGSYQPVPDQMVFFRPPTVEDLDRIATLEAAGYPEDEAATRERLEFRITQAPDLFLCAVQSVGSSGGSPADQIVGYCCGTLTAADGLTEESMAGHEPEGSLLCIHSVCVDEQHRRNGIATKLLQAYVACVEQTTPQLRQIRLICKAPLVGLYQGAGFEEVGPSPVVHGKDPWIEMKLGLEESTGRRDEGYSEWT